MTLISRASKQTGSKGKSSLLLSKFEFSLALISFFLTSFIAMAPTTNEYRLPTLVKYLAKASQLTGLPCALFFLSLRSSQRSSLIQQKIPFMVPGAQAYLPFLGCAFTEKKPTLELYRKLWHQGPNLFSYISTIQYLCLQ